MGVGPDNCHYPSAEDNTLLPVNSACLRDLLIKLDRIEEPGRLPHL